MKKKLFALLILFLFASCTVGRKMGMVKPAPAAPVQLTHPTAVVATDLRPEVLSGKRKPTWCGSTSSTVQIAYPINTESGKTLAEEFALSLQQYLAGASQTVSLWEEGPVADSTAFLHKLRSSADQRVIVLRIYAWHPAANPRLIDIKYECDYNLLLQVYDQSGVVRAAKESKGHYETLETDLASSIKKLQTLAGDIFQKQLGILFGDEAIKAALQ